MTSLMHTLHIGTLATWLSVAGFGSVAIMVPHSRSPASVRPEVEESAWISQDFTLGGETSPAMDDAPSEASANPDANDPAEPIPAPPEMPDLAEPEPLPEIPDIPPPPPAPDRIGKPAPPTRQPTRTDSGPRTPRPVTGKPGTTATAANRHPGGTGAAGPGRSPGDRLAAGSMPSPAYPAESRRLGQTGTLLVEFTIDTSGRVISAYAKSPSPWPLLNQEAVRAVRRWKFPPGPVMTLQRPIDFQLR